jgi:hypothetical protein
MRKLKNKKESNQTNNSSPMTNQLNSPKWRLKKIKNSAIGTKRPWTHPFSNLCNSPKMIAQLN